MGDTENRYWCFEPSTPCFLHPHLITYSTTALKELKALAELGILERRSPSKKKTHYVLAQGPVPDV